MKLLTPFISIVIAEAAGLLGSLVTTPAVKTWYPTLMKPAWNPPASVFGPVWTVLYVLMGIAAAIVWNHRELPGAKAALWVYGVQLVLNLAWSLLFFGLKNPGIALIEICVLLVTIIITTIMFWRVNTWAGVLMLPYIVWVSFATYLNYTIWSLN